LLAGEAIKPSDKKYDWLGPGAYFWEADPHRALEFAEAKVKPGGYTKAAVVGAVIDLGNCLDMSNRQNVELFRAYHRSFLAVQSLGGLPVPENEDARGDPNKDRLLRYLDRAVFVHLHNSIAKAAKTGNRKKDAGNPAVQPFDTVRGVFTEGGPLYDGCGFYERTHVQIAVRNIAECIVGFFKPLRL
jgi:hypothetical protein